MTNVDTDPLLVYDAQEFVREIEEEVSAEQARHVVLEIVEVRTRRSATQFLELSACFPLSAGILRLLPIPVTSSRSVDSSLSCADNFWAIQRDSGSSSGKRAPCIRYITSLNDTVVVDVRPNFGLFEGSDDESPPTL